MVYVFERGGESFKLQTRYDSEAKEYVLTVYGVDGRPRIERFKGSNAFRNRLAALEQQLAAENWVQHGPVLLHDAWKL
jgi:hypothetical protein